MDQVPNPSATPATPRPKNRWWIVLLIVFGVLIFGFIFMAVGFIALLRGSFESKPVSIKSNTVLQLHVRGYIEEYARTAPLALLSSESGHATSFLDLLTAIGHAKEDDRILGLFYRSGDFKCGMAKASELREALRDFKSSGKFIHAYLDLGGELDYYFASVADSIFMPTEGMMELNGFAIQDIFWKESLEKIGIRFHVQQFEEYKSAAESYSRTGFSPFARQSYQALLSARYQAYLQTICADRKLDVRHADAALKRGVYTADTLLALNFIDAIRPESYVRDHLLHLTNGGDSSKHKNTMIAINTYIQGYDKQPAKETIARDKQIAVIFGSGMMLPGDEEAMPAFSESYIASRTFARYLQQARDDKRIKAVILRIDSPGGSVMAADEIWEEIERTKQLKPVYASLSDVAASGGYYMAMACDTIITHAQTVTGSIGVISAIPNFSQSLSKLSASTDTIATSPSALFLNPLMPFTEQDKRQFFRLSANIYQRFVERVAQSRGKTFPQTRELAKGRVWSGEAAVKNGLADTLGGFQTALDMAKRRIGIPEGQKVRLRFYPQPEDPWDAFMKLFDQFKVAENATMALDAKSLTAAWPAWTLLPETVKQQLVYLLFLNYLSEHEKVLTALPALPLIK